ncbi:MAG: tetratricopeptide repeat protein [Bacteroidota bacterium]|nr:tetratricopeptide repeat protein [Bacteroidota bacterium]
MEAYQRGDFESAAMLLEQAAAECSAAEALVVLRRLADAYVEMGRYDRALDALRRALDLDAHAAAVWNDVGIVCRKMGKEGEAREAFERAHACDPDNADILVNLGAAALRLSDLSGAKKSLECALRIAPAHPIAHANLALTLALFGRIEEAEEELRLAVLYGFDGANPIQERIDGLREIRKIILQRRESPPPDTSGGPNERP